MVRAVFEGVAYNSKWLLGYVEKFVKRPLPEIRVIGGGAQSELWCQIMADVLDCTIHQVENPMQANTRGAALLAAVALGHLDVADIGKQVQIANTYTPNPAHRQTYDDQFQTFLQLYKQHSKLLKR
jgi:xylulokinase